MSRTQYDPSLFLKNGCVKRATDGWHAILQPHGFMNVPCPDTNNPITSPAGRLD